MNDRALFLAARKAVSVEALAGRATRLVRAGSEMRGLCPLCAKGRASAPRPMKAEASGDGQAARRRRRAKARGEPFAVSADGQSWRCFRCGEGGDVVDLEAALRGGTAVEAARRLTGGAPLPAPSAPPARKPAARDEGPRSTDRIAAALWREARPAVDTLAAVYLAHRGIPGAVIAAALGNTRFHPRAKWWWDEEARRWECAPAWINLCVIQGEDGRPRATGGVHATYLAPDGRGKASDDGDSKIMWGRQSLNGRPAGAWLIGPRGDQPVALAEGAESALSIAGLEYLRTGRILRCAAALSLDRLQGGVLRDDQKRIDPYDPQPDPARPPFLWSGLGEVWIGLDNDMGPITVRGRTPRGRTIPFVMTGEARTALSGRLAGAGWRGTGAQARLMKPPAGRDFNIELRRVIARLEAAEPADVSV